MALAGAAGADQAGLSGLTAAVAEPVVAPFVPTGPGGGSGANLGFQPTQAVVAKGVFASLLAAMAFYYLHTGRRSNDPGRLLWAAVFGMLTLLALALP